MPIKVTLSVTASIPPNINIFMSISLGTILKLAGALGMPTFGLGNSRIWLSLMTLLPNKFPLIFIEAILNEIIISSF